MYPYPDNFPREEIQELLNAVRNKTIGPRTYQAAWVVSGHALKLTDNTPTPIGTKSEEEILSSALTVQGPIDWKSILRIALNVVLKVLE